MTGRTKRRGLLLRLALSFLLLSAAALGEETAIGPAAEEAADFARRAALAALHGPPQIFLASIDADGVLRHLLGNPVWLGLTNRQQAVLRATVREHFAQALAPASRASSEVAWASVPEAGSGPVFVYLGLGYGSAVLKTRWTVQHTPRGWTIEDIVLLDPGISLAGQVGRLLGPQAVRPRDSAREARIRALPRLLGLAGIAVVALIFAWRLPRGRRPLLWLAASVPAVLFAIDGALAVRRALSERYSLVEALPQQPWRRFETLALEEQRQGHGAEARAAWMQALEAGSPRAPVAFQMGLYAKSQGEGVEARQEFEQALRENPPAPGALKELASIALAERRDAEARQLLETYLRETGPDPDTLATLAVVQTNLGDTAAAVQTIRIARSLVGESWRRAELEAQVYARSGNAEAAVAALRPLEAEGKLNRTALRADPAYLAIATDKAWVTFLSEAPSPSALPPAEP